MKTVAIIQSNYIPWVGYFDIINQADLFILYDDMQYTRRDWRNRNKLNTRQGTKWLSVPVQVKGRYHQKIKDTQISEGDWAAKHWNQWEQHYQQADFFTEVSVIIEEAYSRATPLTHLSKINHLFLRECCSCLGITTPLAWSMDYEVPEIEDPTKRLIAYCQAAGATHYLSGPAARDYMDVDAFRQQGVEVKFMNYEGYPEYSQIHGEFERYVSVIDLLFNVGVKAASRYVQRLALCG